MEKLYKAIAKGIVFQADDCCFFLLFLVFLSLPALGKENVLEPPSIILKDKNEIYHIGRQVLVLPDETKDRSLEDILKLRNEFKLSSQDAPSFGFTTSVVWTILKVKNDTDEDWFLEIGSPYQYIIELHSQDKNGKWEYEKSMLQNFPSRKIRVNQHILPLNLEKGEERTFYMRDETSTAVTFPLRIASMDRLYETNHKEDIVNGLCFGLILALSIYNLFVFITIKDRTYLYYVFYIAFFIINMAWIRGYVQSLVPAEFKALNHSTYPSAAILIFLPLFTSSFLQLKKYNPQLMKFNYVFYILSSLAILFTIVGFTQLGFNMIMLQSFLMIPYVTILGFYTFKKGYKPARYYLLAFMVFTFGVVVFILKDHGLLPYNLFTEYSMQVGNTIETLVLSFALADKLNIYKKEKEESQEQALQQANDFSKQLIQSQEDERKRIAGELHDSVQQSLGVIKNRIALLKIKKDKEKQSKILANGNGEVSTEGDGKNDRLMSEIFEVVTQTIHEVRGISYGLRPFQLDLLGLTQSLKSLAEDISDSMNIEFDISIASVDGIFSKELEINIFRIVQECLNSIAQGKTSEKIAVKIERTVDKVYMVFEDDGVNSGLSHISKGTGLIGIKERISILGGSLKIMKLEPKGTEIRIEIPLRN
jgi:two-component system, sensor histidine kinase LadS